MEPQKPSSKKAPAGSERPSPYDYVIIAAEPSADIHGESLLAQLFQANPDLKIAAIAGPQMRRYPIDLLWPMEDFQVMGFTAILRSLPRLIKKFYRVRRTLLELNPRAILFIDYPGFNLKMAQHLKKKGYQGQLIQYICPSVWAWKKGRIETMASSLDLLIPLFPFEVECFTHTSLPVQFLGHPMTEIIKHRTAPPAPKTMITLFPGSRRKEVENNLPMQFYLGHILASHFDLSLAIVCADESLKPLIQELAPSASLVASHERYEQMERTKLALATSGTITLELALFRVPTLVNFFIKPLDQFLATKVFRINLPYYCIVNILLGREVFPEYFGSNMDASAMLKKGFEMLEDKSLEQKIQREGRLLFDLLDRGNGAKNLANTLLSRI